MDYDVDKIVGRIQKLPTISTVAFEIIQMCSNPSTTVKQLKSVIATDQSLTAQILRIANSSYYNYPRTIHSIERAIIILGFRMVQDIAISIAVYSFYRGIRNTNGFDVKDLWRHVLSTALIAKMLGFEYDPELQSMLYVGGLLHDIGKLVENVALQEDFSFIFEKSRQEGVRLDVIEDRFFNFTHADIGGKLLNKWNLPPQIVDMVRYHHNPSPENISGERIHYIRIVYLANLLAHFINRKWKSIHAVLQYDIHFKEVFQFSEPEFMDLVERSKEVLQDNQMYFEILQV